MSIGNIHWKYQNNQIKTKHYNRKKNNIFVSQKQNKNVIHLFIKILLFL